MPRSENLQGFLKTLENFLRCHIFQTVLYYQPSYTAQGLYNNSQYEKVIARTVFPTLPDAAHQHKIIHRDVKPSNFLFDATGEIFLSDFGIAKAKGFTDDEGSWLVGTPAYMSPEQVLGNTVDGRADIYALGIVLYRLLTGQLPFSNSSVTALINAHVEMPIPDIRSIKHNIPSVWQEVVGKAMAKDPNDRYATASEFARDIAEVVSGKWYLRKL